MMHGKRSSSGLLGGAAVAILLAVGGLTACSSTDSPSELTSIGPDSGSIDGGGTSTDEPTPSQPPAVIQTEHVGQTPQQATDELVLEGFLVAYEDSAGNPVPNAVGWSVAGEQPPVGTSLPAGSTVELVVSPPPPPPPPAPAPPAAPAQPDPATSGATALCNDGTLSYSAHHQGTCSHHDGVAVWYK